MILHVKKETTAIVISKSKKLEQKRVPTGIYNATKIPNPFGHGYSQPIIVVRLPTGELVGQTETAWRQWESHEKKAFIVSMQETGETILGDKSEEVVLIKK